MAEVYVHQQCDVLCHSIVAMCMCVCVCVCVVLSI